MHLVFFFFVHFPQKLLKQIKLKKNRKKKMEKQEKTRKQCMQKKSNYLPPTLLVFMSAKKKLVML